MRLRRWIPIAVLALIAGGCGRIGIIGGHAPKILIGDENEVTIETESFGRPDAIAKRHCALHGKAAVYDGMLRPDQYYDQRLVYYHCR